LLGEVGAGDGNPGGTISPGHPVDASQRELTAEAPSDQAPLTAGDAGDEHLLARLRAGSWRRRRAHDRDLLARGPAARHSSFWTVGRASHPLAQSSPRARTLSSATVPPHGGIPGGGPRLNPCPGPDPSPPARAPRG